MAPALSLGVPRRGSRISVRGGRQGIDDLIWDGDERFVTYANTDLQLFKMFIAILCLNGDEQPFKGHQCPFFLSLRRRNPRLRRGSLRPRGGRRTQRPPWIRAWCLSTPNVQLSTHNVVKEVGQILCEIRIQKYFDGTLSIFPLSAPPISFQKLG